MARDNVTVERAVQFRKWQSPNFATLAGPPKSRQDGLAPLPSIPVAELGVETLDALAQAWIDELYTKVGIDVPKLTRENT